jgi:iron complex outermembrane recepter protein
MVSSTIPSSTLIFKLSLLSLAICSIPFSLNIHAQEVYEKEVKEETEVIEITGSRIRRTEMEAVTPVISVSGDDLRKTGALNINDALNKMPMIVPDVGDM